MEDLISIVVPIYNVENYLKKCVETIIGQTYKNLEIILVDDGSTDNSGKICDEMKEIDNRIRVIHKENGGLSDARNVGLDEAHGKYISFIDSDDYIDSNFIETLYKMCIENNAEIAQCNFRKVGYDFKDKEDEKIETIVKNGKQMIYDIYSGKHMIYIVAWNKLYKTEIFGDIRYPKGKINEDEATTYKLFYKANKVAVTNKKLYNDVYRKNSIMNSKYNIKRLDAIWAFEKRIEFFEEKNEYKLIELTKVAYTYELMRAYANVKEYIDNSKDIQLELKNKYKKTAKNLLKSKINLKKKIILIYGIVFPNLYSKRFIIK